MFDLLEEINNPKGTPLKYNKYKEYEVPSSFEKRSMDF